MKRLLEYDASRGLRMDYVGHGDGTFSIEYTQDVEPLLDLNKVRQNEGRSYYAKDGDMWRVASIPIVVQYEWARRYGITDVCAPEFQKKVVQLLNSSEWRYLKTADVII